MYFIFWYDYLLVPVYLVLAIVILNNYFRKRHGHNPELKKHFKRGYLLKLFGCVAIGLIYEHYYRGSFDGRFYFEGSKMLTNYWLEYPSQIFHVLFNDIKDFNQTNLLGLNMYNARVFAETSFFVSKVAAVLNLLSFNAFLPCSIFFCVIAYIALWNFFIFIYSEFNLNYLIAGLCTIYIPSVLIWDSSIFKDTITFTALCWLFICGYYLFIKPRRLIANSIGLIASAFFISQTKVYILAAFAPFFILFVFYSLKSKIKNNTLKVLSTPFIILFSIGGIVLFMQNADELLGRYALEEVLETAAKTATDMGAIKAGSGYTMNVDLSSPVGILLAFPNGVNATLFRPYPWEYLKVFILFASVESMIYLYFTIKIIRNLGLKKTYQLIAKIPILQFTLFFSLVFAFMVGISTTNFGTLVRYKIPILPFYALFLGILYTYSNQYTKLDKPKIPSSRKKKNVLWEYHNQH